MNAPSLQDESRLSGRESDKENSNSVNETEDEKHEGESEHSDAQGILNRSLRVPYFHDIDIRYQISLHIDPNLILMKKVKKP